MWKETEERASSMASEVCIDNVLFWQWTPLETEWVVFHYFVHVIIMETDRHNLL